MQASSSCLEAGIVRWLGALAAIVVANVLALPLYAVSFEPSGPVDRLVVRVLLILSAGGLVVGACVPRYWYAAAAVACYPLVVGLMAPIRNCSNAEPFPYYCVTTVELFWIAPILALAAGYLGARLYNVLEKW